MDDKNKIRTLVQNNRLSDAKLLCISVCKASPDDAEAWFLHGMLSGMMLDFAGAEVCYSNVIRLMPDLAAAYYNKGIALHSLKKYQEALHVFTRVMDMEPAFENINVAVADAYFSLGQTSSALKYYQAALIADKNNVRAGYQLGVLLLQDSNYAAAEKYFRKIISLNPGSAEAKFNLASCLQMQGDFTESEKLYKGAIELRPDYYLAYNNLGILYKDNAMFDVAAQHFTKAINARPDYADAYSNLGHAYQMLGVYDKALVACLKAKELRPDSTETHYSLGLQYEKLGQYANARHCYKQASLLDSTSTRYPFVMARVFALEKNYDEAISHYNKVITADTSFTDAYCNIGKLYLETGDKRAASEYFKIALSIQPDNIAANYYLAELDPSHAVGVSKTLYVEKLFDNYADTFEAELVQKLHYVTPKVIYREVAKFIEGQSGLVIFDLGCGTGLCGELFRDCASRLVGVDLSSKIIDKAREKAVYDELHVGELTAILQKEADSIDVILAADVFVYIGDLKATMQASKNALKSDGLFCFSVEHKEGESFVLQGSGRYAHSVAYIQGLASNAGLRIVSQTSCALRKEYGVDVQGDVYVLRGVGDMV